MKFIFQNTFLKGSHRKCGVILKNLNGSWNNNVIAIPQVIFWCMKVPQTIEISIPCFFGYLQAYY